MIARCVLLKFDRLHQSPKNRDRMQGKLFCQIQISLVTQEQRELSGQNRKLLLGSVQTKGIPLYSTKNAP